MSVAVATSETVAPAAATLSKVFCSGAVRNATAQVLAAAHAQIQEMHANSGSRAVGYVIVVLLLYALALGIALIKILDECTQTALLLRLSSVFLKRIEWNGWFGLALVSMLVLATCRIWVRLGWYVGCSTQLILLGLEGACDRSSGPSCAHIKTVSHHFVSHCSFTAAVAAARTALLVCLPDCQNGDDCNDEVQRPRHVGGLWETRTDKETQDEASRREKQRLLQRA
ncbi:hypothetical protein BIW11_12735 [Tropilaelaps mercedesae]|uniref:Uncharacterized protein n=1 Tax=Tropilaelaps mercedesae TaxID=418985 RepID=A0A1V9X5L6_9ACAR|nr:hypothetical protein BIW11_12735 [Tropilaelaps mercedesae]